MAALGQQAQRWPRQAAQAGGPGRQARQAAHHRRLEDQAPTHRLDGAAGQVVAVPAARARAGAAASVSPAAAAGRRLRWSGACSAQQSPAATGTISSSRAPSPVDHAVLWWLVEVQLSAQQQVLQHGQRRLLHRPGGHGALRGRGGGRAAAGVNPSARKAEWADAVACRAASSAAQHGPAQAATGTSAHASPPPLTPQRPLGATGAPGCPRARRRATASRAPPPAAPTPRTCPR
jgi:hypothetical protein